MMSRRVAYILLVLAAWLLLPLVILAARQLGFGAGVLLALVGWAALLGSLMAVRRGPADELVGRRARYLARRVARRTRSSRLTSAKRPHD